MRWTRRSGAPKRSLPNLPSGRRNVVAVSQALDRAVQRPALDGPASLVQPEDRHVLPRSWSRGSRFGPASCPVTRRPPRTSGCWNRSATMAPRCRSRRAWPCSTSGWRPCWPCAVAATRADSSRPAARRRPQMQLALSVRQCTSNPSVMKSGRLTGPSSRPRACRAPRASVPRPVSRAESAARSSRR
jgi:hypothetical protein